MKKVLLFCLFSLLVSKLAIFSSGCANIIPPEGGPRDSLAPVLMKVTPPDSTRNFSGNKIVFTFDEFVDLQSARENIFISPNPEREPIVDYRLNTVTLKLNNKLDSNTTYVVNFGNAIRDYNEGNVFKNFSYTFSTGRYIDSLELNGEVILAENGKIDTTLIVLLHTSPKDSAVANERPRYIAKLDGRGRFHFSNLPPRTFYLYALKDMNGSRRYYAQNLNSLFAFADKPVQLSDSTKPVTFYAYAPVKQTTQPTQSSGPSLSRLGKGNLGADNRLRYQTNLANNLQELTSPLIMTFERPLRLFDSTRIKLYTDSVYTPVTGYRFHRDSLNKKIELLYDWKENTSYHLVLDKDFAEDTAGKKLLKTDTLSFKTKTLADYGSLKLKFRNLDLARHPVLQIVAGETIVRSVKLTSTDFSVAQFPPGEYELRILFDDNNNGVWDPGEFFGKHKQPELVKPIDRKINVKASWQNEFDIDTPGK